MAHFEQFFCDPHSPYTQYVSFAVLETTAKLHLSTQSLNIGNA